LLLPSCVYAYAYAASICIFFVSCSTSPGSSGIYYGALANLIFLVYVFEQAWFGLVLSRVLVFSLLLLLNVITFCCVRDWDWFWLGRTGQGGFE